MSTQLAVGQRRRVRHCGEDRAALESRGHNGVRLYCFRCGHSGFTPLAPELRRPLPPPTPKLARYPEDAGVPLPVKYRAWLAGMGFGEWERNNLLRVFWSEELQRAVFPASGQFWLARSLSDQPKWLTAPYGRDKCVQVFGPAQPVLSPGVVVLTEDLLSAAKIGNALRCGGVAGTLAVPCFGTSPSPAVLAYAASAGSVVVWLDPDDAGQRAGLRVALRLRAIGRAATVMPTRPGDKDPKLLANEEILCRLHST